MKHQDEIWIKLKDLSLPGILVLPENASGLVIFSHGSGSSRLSSRNNYVASVLNRNKLGTLLFDLLTEKEDLIYENRFNIDLLTHRLIEVTLQLKKQSETGSLNFGLFGASTGAASALKAAAKLPKEIKAVVSRGGRVDMAEESLQKLEAPTLFIVGEKDEVVLQLNQTAFEQISGTKEMEIIPGATHLFEEEGALDKVADLTADWFNTYL